MKKLTLIFSLSLLLWGTSSAQKLPDVWTLQDSLFKSVTMPSKSLYGGLHYALHPSVGTLLIEKLATLKKLAIAASQSDLFSKDAIYSLPSNVKDCYEGNFECIMVALDTNTQTFCVSMQQMRSTGPGGRSGYMGSYFRFRYDPLSGNVLLFGEYIVQRYQMGGNFPYRVTYDELVETLETLEKDLVLLATKNKKGK